VISSRPLIVPASCLAPGESRGKESREQPFRRCSLSMLLSPIVEEVSCSRGPSSSEACHSATAEGASSPVTSPERFTSENAASAALSNQEPRLEEGSFEPSHPGLGSSNIENKNMDTSNCNKADVANLIEQNASDLTHSSVKEDTQTVESPCRSPDIDAPETAAGLSDEDVTQVEGDELPEKEADENGSGSEEVESEETRCPCGSKENFGFMICCETCSSWQHGKCMGFRRSSEAPDEYYCDVCRPDLIRPSSIAHTKAKDKKSTRDNKSGDQGRNSVESSLLQIKSSELRRMFLSDYRTSTSSESSQSREKSTLFSRWAKLLKTQYLKERDAVITGLEIISGLSNQEVIEKLEECSTDSRKRKSSSRKFETLTADSSGRSKESKEKPSFEEQTSPSLKAKKRARPLSKDSSNDERYSNGLSREDRKMKHIMQQFQRLEERQKRKADGEPGSPEIKPLILSENGNPSRIGEVTIMSALEKRRKVMKSSGTNFSYPDDFNILHGSRASMADQGSPSTKNSPPSSRPSSKDTLPFSSRAPSPFLPPLPGPSVLQRVCTTSQKHHSFSNASFGQSRKSRILKDCRLKLSSLLSNENLNRLPLKKKYLCFSRISSASPLSNSGAPELSSTDEPCDANNPKALEPCSTFHRSLEVDSNSPKADGSRVQEVAHLSPEGRHDAPTDQTEPAKLVKRDARISTGTVEPSPQECLSDPYRIIPNAVSSGREEERSGEQNLENVEVDSPIPITKDSPTQELSNNKDQVEDTHAGFEEGWETICESSPDPEGKTAQAHQVEEGTGKVGSGCEHFSDPPQRLDDEKIPCGCPNDLPISRTISSKKEGECIASTGPPLYEAMQAEPQPPWWLASSSGESHVWESGRKLFRRRVLEYLAGQRHLSKEAVEERLKDLCL